MVVKVQQVLKRELKSKRMSASSLAKNCGIPASVLHGWLQGTLPSAKNLHLIAKLSQFLGLPVSVLLFDLEEKGPKVSTIFKSHFSEGESEFQILVTKTNKN